MVLAIPSPQSVYRGNYASLPAATLKPPVEGNRTIPVSIQWQAAGLGPNYCVAFNAQLQQTLAINQISAIHVDNSKCSSSMHIGFTDTQFEILIGPNSVGFYPVVTNSLNFFAWIDLQPSAQDVTILQVLNFLPPPILFGTQLGGGSGVGTVREVDTQAPIVGGPITDQGTIGLSVPLAVNFGGTAGTTGNAALDNLSGASGATTGALQRSGTGVWSVAAGAGSGTITGVTPGNGLQGGGTSGTVSLALNAPVTVANGGTGAGAGNAALDNLAGQSGANAGLLQRTAGGGWATLVALPLPVASGGTGASTAPAALTALGAAPLASPVFTGAPQVPTASPATTSNTQAASTAFTQAAITAALAPVQVSAGAGNVGRNLLDNAQFNFWQRGTGPFAGNALYGADRWQNLVSLDTFSVSYVNLSDAQRAQIGDEAAAGALQATFTGNAGAAAYSILVQKLESGRRLGGKTVTVSFWAAAGAALAVSVNLVQYFGTGGSPSAFVTVPAPGTIALSTTFARYTATLTLPSLAGKTFGTNNDNYTEVCINFSSGATNSAAAGGLGVQSGVVTLWGMQCEIGSSATPLEKIDLASDLARCQRFYINTGNIGVAQYQANPGYGCGCTVSFPAPMRATPTITLTQTTATNAGSPSVPISGPGNFMMQVLNTVAGAMQWGGTYTASADL